MDGLFGPISVVERMSMCGRFEPRDGGGLSVDGPNIGV